MEKTTTIRNPGPKLLWLRLNSGEHVSIAADAGREVSTSQINGNRDFEKLRSRKLVEIVSSDAEVAALPSGAEPSGAEGHRPGARSAEVASARKERR